jgi:hypothetical protein
MRKITYQYERGRSVNIKTYLASNMGRLFVLTLHQVNSGELELNTQLIRNYKDALSASGH